jgi:riboflavin kinase/FMN adenylyltransferase
MTCRAGIAITVVHGTLDAAADPLAHAAARERGPCVVAIGKFDGLHRGHRALLSRVVDEARRRGWHAGVVTFDTHPGEVLRGVRHACLTTLRDREALYAQMGLDFMFVLRATPALLATEADAFASTLISSLDCRVIVVGADFRFGRAVKGDLSTLAQVAHRLGAEVIGVELHEQSGARVSSTRIRAELAAGRVEHVAVLLGRCFVISGTLEAGPGRVATMEVPHRMAVPAAGTYLGRVTSPGTRNTSGPTLIEVEAAADNAWRLRIPLGRLSRSACEAECSVAFERSVLEPTPEPWQ